MASRDTDCSPVFFVRFRVPIRKLISVLYVVPNIWSGVYGNSGATIKTNIYMSTTFLNKSKRRNRVGVVCSVII